MVIFNIGQGPAAKIAEADAQACVVLSKVGKTRSLKSGAAVWELHISFCGGISPKANLETSITAGQLL